MSLRQLEGAIADVGKPDGACVVQQLVGVAHRLRTEKQKPLSCSRSQKEMQLGNLNEPKTTRKS